MAQPGWITTRSPMRLLATEALAPMLQWRPMRTLGPITAPALITVPVPISARGPITAPGSTVTPFSMRALGWTKAPTATPLASNNDDGRKASGKSARATSTNARYGSATQSTLTWLGARAAYRSVIKQAPAVLSDNWGAYLALSRNARSLGAA